MRDGSTNIFSNNEFNATLRKFKRSHHSKCIFQNCPPVENLRFDFDENGILKGTFTCTSKHQGYDGIVHGGIIASIIDASMAQCCMGHGIAAYTANLTIRYRAPLKILIPAYLETKFVKKALGILFMLQCKITQKNVVNVEASGRFFKLSQTVHSESE